MISPQRQHVLCPNCEPNSLRSWMSALSWLLGNCVGQLPTVLSAQKVHVCEQCGLRHLAHRSRSSNTAETAGGCRHPMHFPRRPTYVAESTIEMGCVCPGLVRRIRL